MKAIIYILIHVLFIIGFVSCKKEWLDEKSDKSKFIPQSIDDLQALLQNERYFNSAYNFLPEAGTDDYFLQETTWSVLRDDERNLYTWSKDIFESGTCFEWNTLYQRIFVANTVIKGLDNLAENEQNSDTGKKIRGTALFLRAYALYNIAQAFAPQYSSSTAMEAGVPIRLGSEINETIRRNSVQENYDQILHDLETALELLPVLNKYGTEPGKTAVHAAMARVYLSMREYDKALEHSTESLNLVSTLIDYNTIDAVANFFPFPRFNAEVIFQENSYEPSWFYFNRCRVDTSLYDSYAINDLRKDYFFYDNGNRLISYRGSYDGGTSPFTGLATDEQYLIAAECYARKGNTAKAQDLLNTLLQNRWRTGTFNNYTEEDPDILLTIILQERRKELLFRNLRWTDLRRLNAEPRFEKTIYRVLGDMTFTLAPGSPNYVLPIPPDVLLRSGIEQNKRE